MNSVDKLMEATQLAIQGKLNEVYTKEYIGTFNELYDSSWGPAKEILQHIADLGLEKECMDWLEDFGTEDNPIDRTELNDYIWNNSEDLYDALGLDENGDPINDELEEAKNPENIEINDKIRKSLNGSTKYKDDLEKAGLNVSQDEKGKVTNISNSNGRSMNKQDLKNSNPDTDYYNYLTKDKVAPEVTDTGAFDAINPFRNSDNFKSTISGSDRRVFSTDANGVSNAIPKKYKTGKKNYNIDLDKFPRKSYNGVASYEPIDNKELNDFKYAKSTTGEGGWRKEDLDKAKAEYDRAKAEYDKYDNTVKDVRDRIAKSKEKTGEKKTEGEDVIKLSGHMSKKTESAGSMDTRAYWTFVLGYDLMQNELKDYGPESDVAFERAWKIAGDFMASAEWKNPNKSGYDALVEYLKNNNLIK